MTEKNEGPHCPLSSRMSAGSSRDPGERLPLGATGGGSGVGHRTRSIRKDPSARGATQDDSGKRDNKPKASQRTPPWVPTPSRDPAPASDPDSG